MISVLIIDDEQLVRGALKFALKDAEGIKVVGEAENGEEALAKIREKKPNVLLLDLHLPDISGINITRKILRQFRGIKIIIITSQTNEAFPVRLLDAGVHGYFTKEADRNEIIQAIKDVYKGKRVISPQIAHQLAISKTIDKPSIFDKLSDREMEVLLMILQGIPTETIANKLHLSPKTVSTYRINVFKKLNVGNNAELLLLGIRYRLVT